ncbi:response regulator [Cellulomonas fengjieae]|uniref:response regulator n=1 Tax=Cellulomonas fengjieae TaxID=2819978 RepID=UPI001AAFD140|nr:response regulator transcription factor [Cellulomonas fengjieae]MBO3103496.1 response regulator transcription factor [Cellulomonas fengjieae]
MTAPVIRVLLADDQPLVRAGIAMLLSAEPGLEVVAQAEDGERAVALTRSLHPDVVLMDVRMPRMDGVEATRALVEDGDGVVRVLVLTTYHVDDAVYAALRAGASGFLLKDAAPESLIAAVRAVADGDAWLDPVVAKGLLAEFAARPDPLRRSPGDLARLTPREREVLVLVAHGLSNTEIASRLFIGEATVKTHLGRVMVKLGLRDRAQAVAIAYRSGLVSPV